MRIADVAAALSTDTLRGTDTAFDQRLHALREHRGQRASAANLWSLMRGSAIWEFHRTGDVRVQDPYSVRGAPQVHGAVRDVVDDVEAKVAIEINAVSDNPLVFCDGAGGREQGVVPSRLHRLDPDLGGQGGPHFDGHGGGAEAPLGVANVRRVLAIELVAAAQGIDLLCPLRSSERLEAVHGMIRERVAFRGDDREMAGDLALGVRLLDDLDLVLDTLD